APGCCAGGRNRTGSCPGAGAGAVATTPTGSSTSASQEGSPPRCSARARDQLVHVRARQPDEGELAVVVARPLLLGPIPCELQSVAVGIREVGSLVRSVVGEVVDRPTCIAQPAQRIPE